jgi:hypothetical protein
VEQSAERAKVTYNLVGPFGANLADLLYQIFGLTALCHSTRSFSLFGWWQWNENRSPLSRSKVVGTMMMLIALTGIFTILSNNQPPKAFYLGGTIGRWLVYGEMTGLSVFLGSVGAVFALVSAVYDRVGDRDPDLDCRDIHPVQPARTAVERLNWDGAWILVAPQSGSDRDQRTGDSWP